MESIDIAVLSGGFCAGKANVCARITVGGSVVQMPTGYGRGLNVAVLDQTSGAVVHTETFDLVGDPARTADFVGFIQQLPVGRLVCIALQEDAAMSPAAQRACRTIGSGLIGNLQGGNSWALIGARGAAPGAAVEQLFDSAPATALLTMPLQPADQAVVAISASSSAGAQDAAGSASIAVSGVEVPMLGGYRRGLNVAVFADDARSVLSTQVYDTATSIAEAEAFADDIAALPAGRMVAIAVNGRASTWLTQRALEACERLGSARIRGLGDGVSWALVGFKGAVPGTVAEALSATTRVQCVYWHFPEVDDTSPGFPLALSAAGSAAESAASVSVGRYPALAFGPWDSTTGDGLNVAVISDMSGALADFHRFDTSAGETAATNFATLVERAPLGCIIAVAAQGAAARHLTDRAKRACEMIGSARIHELADKGSWALIGRKGCAPGSVPEVLMSDGAVGIEAWFTTTGPRSIRPFVELLADSAGHDVGNLANLAVAPNSSLVRLSDGYKRGLNVCVLDETTGDVLSAGTYDTFASDSEADRFAAMIEGLPAGRVAMVAVMDEATKHLTERAKQACESLGSAKIRSLGHRGSWALIGKKDAASTAVAEAMSNDARARCAYWLFPDRLPPDPGFNLGARSAGHDVGNAAQLVVKENIVPIPGEYGRGLNVVVIDEASGDVLQADRYDTFDSADRATAFAALIEGLPAGRCVAIAVQDEATEHLTERAKRACESLGSGQIRSLEHRGSWALIGFKGTPPGSALEQVFNKGPASVSTWVPYPTEPATRALPVVAALAGLIAVEVLVIAIASILLPAIEPGPITPPPMPPPPAPRDLTSWLSKVPDACFISEISIPGTHDSAAINQRVPTPLACHRTSITAQLESGIRLLDIRLKVIQETTGGQTTFRFMTCHGDFLGNEYQSFALVLDECKAFLQKHPTEFVAMSLKVDNPRNFDPPGAVCNALADLLKSYPIYTNKNLPRLKDVRAHIYLLNRIKATDSRFGAWIGWPNNTCFSQMRASENRAFALCVQDVWENPGGTQRKLKLFTAAIDQWSKRPDDLLLNFASATQSIVEGTPPIFGVYIMYDLLSSWASKPANERPAALGWSLFDYENSFYFTANPRIVVNVVQLIVSANFGYDGYQDPFTVYRSPPLDLIDLVPW